MIDLSILHLLDNSVEGSKSPGQSVPCVPRSINPNLGQNLSTKSSVSHVSHIKKTMRRNKNTLTARAKDDFRAVIQEVTSGILDPEPFMQNLNAEDWADIHAGRITAEQLRAFAEMMAERLTRERGEIPEGWPATTACRHCGEVAIWSGCPNEVLGCPWCHRS